MLDSLEKIFDSYIDGMNRYEVFSVEMIRGDNPEDLYFVCRIGGKQYVVFETDYVDSLSFPLKEATEIVANHGLAPLRWLVKKESQGAVGSAYVSIQTSDIDTYRDALIREADKGSYLIHAIIELDPVLARINGLNSHTNRTPAATP